MLLADMLLKSLAYGLPYLVSEIFDFAASFSLNILDLISYQIQTSHKFLSSWGRECLSSQVSSNLEFCWKGSGEDPNRPSHIFEFPWTSGSWWCLEKHFEGWRENRYFWVKMIAFNLHIVGATCSVRCRRLIQSVHKIRTIKKTQADIAVVSDIVSSASTWSIASVHHFPARAAKTRVFRSRLCRCIVAAKCLRAHAALAPEYWC